MTLTKTQSNLGLLTSAFIWGISYTFIKQCTDAHMSAGLINGGRGLIFATLLYIFFHKTIHHITWQEVKLGAIGGLLNVAVVLLQTTGLKYTTPSNSSFLTATYVLFVPIVVWITQHQRPQRKLILAIILCLIGTTFLTGIIQTGFHLQLGDILTLCSAIFVSLQIVYYSALGTRLNPINSSFMLAMSQIVVSGGMSLLFERQGYGAIDWPHAILPLIALGITASFMAQTLQIFCQQFADPTTSGLLLMTESLFASLVSVLVGIEPVTSNLVIGGSLIFVALLLMQLDLHRLSLWRRQRF
ncbi:DMT family transporter [Secundilactobacillus muriivasis]